MERRAVRGRQFIRRPRPGERFGLPQAICAQEGVERAGQATHDSHEGELVGLAVVQQALLAGLGVRLAAGGDRVAM
ncbi:MAG: hypothetical protein OXD30_03055 [Bryobacterales bacterium]|nr:hypothetical protein [Bryobacterales bacterium]